MSILTDQSKMPFGKHKGKPLAEVPDQYLVWLYGTNIEAGPLRTYIEESVPEIVNKIAKKKQIR